MAKADPRRIHELEYELGFRDDPPLPAFQDIIFPLSWTDEPGAVIQYRPPGNLPSVDQI